MSAPAVVAYLHQNNHTPDMRGVSIHYEPSNLAAHTTTHPLIKQEEYQAKIQQIIGLIEGECVFWHGRDESRRGEYAILRAVVMEIAGVETPTKPRGDV